LTTKRWIQAGLLFLATAFVVWAAIFIFRTSFIASDGQRYFSLFDDAMISMRYAWNFSHGSGLVWNPGERVEGYTNLLMVGLMSVWTSLFDKSSAVLAVQLTGIPILLGIAALARLHWLELARGNDILHRDGFGALVFMGSLLYYPLAYWTLMGMETGLLTLLLLTGSLLSLVHMRTGAYPPLVGGAAALGLAYLARPDSAPLAALLLGTATLLGTGTVRGRFSVAAIALAIYLLFPILQTGFRAVYYGSLVPVTYTLKATGMPFAVRVENGINFTRPFAQEARWAHLLGVSGVLLGFTKRKALLLLPPLTLVAYQVMIGGDAWASWRLVAPGLPYLVLLTLASADWIVGAFVPLIQRYRVRPWVLPGKRDSRHRRDIAFPRLSLSRVVGLVAVILVVGGLLADIVRSGSSGFGFAQRYLLGGGILLAFAATIMREQPIRHLVGFGVALSVLVSLNRAFLQEAVLFRLADGVEKHRDHVNVSLSINEFTTEAASVGVFWAGIIPYYTSRYAIDFLGRNDPYIASLPAHVTGLSSRPGHNKYDLEYSILDRKPTYVEGFRWGSQDLSYVFEDLYVEISAPGPDPAFLRGDPAVRWDIIPPDKLLYP